MKILSIQKENCMPNITQKPTGGYFPIKWTMWEFVISLFFS